MVECIVAGQRLGCGEVILVDEAHDVAVGYHLGRAAWVVNGGVGIGGDTGAVAVELHLVAHGYVDGSVLVNDSLGAAVQRVLHTSLRKFDHDGAVGDGLKRQRDGKRIVGGRGGGAIHSCHFRHQADVLLQDDVGVVSLQLGDGVAVGAFHFGLEAHCEDACGHDEVGRLCCVRAQGQAFAEVQRDGCAAADESGVHIVHLIVTYKIHPEAVSQHDAANGGGALHGDAEDAVGAVESEVAVRRGGAHREGVRGEVGVHKGLRAAHRQLELALGGQLDARGGIESIISVGFGQVAAEGGVRGSSTRGDIEVGGTGFRLVGSVHLDLVASVPHQPAACADFRLGVAVQLADGGLEGHVAVLFILLAAGEGQHCEGAEAHEFQCLFHCCYSFSLNGVRHYHWPLLVPKWNPLPPGLVEVSPPAEAHKTLSGPISMISALGAS